ncbi:MAG TPA: hypothetical protein DCQ47_01665 [Gammaproteobacteria bacterium]|nr:hypothetical protein [Gammaproteobacteria bacterium]
MKLRIELIGHDILVHIEKACKYLLIKLFVRCCEEMFFGLDTEANRTHPLYELFRMYDCVGLDAG